MGKPAPVQGDGKKKAKKDKDKPNPNKFPKELDTLPAPANPNLPKGHWWQELLVVHPSPQVGPSQDLRVHCQSTS